MRAALTTFLAAAALSSSVAVAGPHGHGHDKHARHGHYDRTPVRPVSGPPVASQIRIDNDAGTTAVVYVDGTYRGEVRRGDERGFTAPPGARMVRVTDDRGQTLFDGRVVATPSRVVEVDVRPLLATLRLHNDGHAPLLVTVPGHAGFWLMPDTRQTVQTLPGVVPVTTAMYTPRGLETVGNRTVQAIGGRTMEHDIGWCPPAPTSQITIINQEPRTLRVYVAGREIAEVPAGTTRSFDVAAGRQLVTVVEHRGRILYNDTVSFDAREDHRIRMSGGRGFASAQILTTRYVMR